MSNVPKLRFKEFSGDWEEKKLKHITNKINSGSTPRGGDKVYKGSGIPFIRSQNVNFNQFIIDKVTYIDETTHRIMKNSCVKANDILLNITGASIGRSCVVPNDFIEGNVNQHVCILRLNENFKPTFLQPLLASGRGQKLIFQGQTGSGREGINFQSIGAFKLNIPQKLEQEKIASFLTSIDTKIEQLTKKESLLQEYKKGVMQKIFNQEIRFKADDGSEFCDWEEKKLKEIGKFKSGTGFTEKEQGGKEGIPFYKVSDMNLITNEEYMNISNNYVTQEQIKRLKFKVVKEKAIIFAKVGAAIFLERKRLAENFLIDNNMMAFIPNEDILYVRHYFNTIRLSKYAQVGALPSYNASDLETIKIQIPCLEEQIKIANFLSEIDSKINKTKQQLDSTKEFKKALLQQMFV